MLRILSDLHVNDGLSRIHRLEQLDPLLEGPDALLINGDSCDTQGDHGRETAQALTAHLRSRAPNVTFLTGNHDPDISSQHEALLQAGRVWVTHGDVFFPDATPWSRLRPELRRRIAAAERETDPRTRDSLEWRLRIYRQIAVGLPTPHDAHSRSWRRLAERVLTEFGSARRVWAVVQAWRQGAALAAQLTRRYRPSADVVIFGHIHRAFLGQRDGRTIINTGAFAGALRAWCVDLVDDRLHVREIQQRRGSFHAGRVLTEIPLAARANARLSSAA